MNDTGRPGRADAAFQRAGAAQLGRVARAEVRWAERMRERATTLGQSWMENVNRVGAAK